MLDAVDRHDADFSVTVKQYAPVAAAIHALAADPATVWSTALGAEDERGSEVAETLLGRQLRLLGTR